jgi:cytosine/adenosine deaminase-related metal-dependent hydrolase
LLDTVYLMSSVDGKPLEGVQRRFGDGDLDGWANRFADLRDAPGAKIGAALHSVRAVPAEIMAPFAQRTAGLPVHVHLSEQRAENEQCRAVHGRSPDIDILRGHHVCLCPTTERDLADGIGPARRLADAGARLSLGSDSNAVIDPFAEARAMEMDERLATERRGHFGADELLAAAANHESIGWSDAGAIAVGRRADLVAVRLESVRTAGVDPAGAMFAATAADVTDVIVDGRIVVAGGRHTGFDVPAALRAAIA